MVFGHGSGQFAVMRGRQIDRAERQGDGIFRNRHFGGGLIL